MKFNMRRIYFIKKDFQTRFILRFVISATIWAVLSVLFFVLIAEKKLDEVRYSTHIVAKTTSDVLLPTVLWVQGLTLLAFAVMLAYAVKSLWSSLAGPLYGLKKDITRVAGGDLVDPVSLREEEEFHDLAVDMDTMRNELRRRWARIREGNDALISSMDELRQSIHKGSPSVHHATQLREAVARMKEGVNDFTY